MYFISFRQVNFALYFVVVVVVCCCCCCCFKCLGTERERAKGTYREVAHTLYSSTLYSAAKTDPYFVGTLCAKIQPVTSIPTNSRVWTNICLYTHTHRNIEMTISFFVSFVLSTSPN